ncbi:hypothetical protein GQ55_5G461000 [Panicum hallii var. hallii]|uniref:Uncharacterized protein n=1 Tax=Panicum hallii var. hallii TaxID=1504633 RepID=A0A2T7DQH1_9POAL|nr:hypothetical protein GQ55_5G461000 [Panicum hallii var. hallii]
MMVWTRSVHLASYSQLTIQSINPCCDRSKWGRQHQPRRHPYRQPSVGALAIRCEMARGRCGSPFCFWG